MIRPTVKVLEEQENHSENIHKELQDKAILYVNLTGDFFILHYFFEQYSGHNLLTSKPFLSGCNSLFIRKVNTPMGTILHKLQEYEINKKKAIEKVKSFFKFTTNSHKHL
ncbi:hypothetical protein NUSPORA_01611 [Nucleospora cyclopteri]